MHFEPKNGKEFDHRTLLFHRILNNFSQNSVPWNSIGERLY
jgi:hypothetical protein